MRHHYEVELYCETCERTVSTIINRLHKSTFYLGCSQCRNGVELICDLSDMWTRRIQGKKLVGYLKQIKEN